MTSTSAPSPLQLPASADDLTRVLVVGAGQMGAGIAQVCAQSGRDVVLADLDPAAIGRARTGIAGSADRLHAKQRLSDAQRADIDERIEYLALDDVDLAAGGGAHIAIEAIVEAEGPKRELLARLDAGLPAAAIIASNTSSIPITSLAAATGRATRVIGMHFMNPVPMLDLVEVIPGLETDPEVTALVLDLARALGKVPVESADTPGFITNRILMPLINEAFFCLEGGVGSAEAIDDAMRLGMKHPLGPLALADLIGLDTCLNIMEVLHHDLGDKYRPCPLLRRYVEAGRLGRKSGAGVYEHGKG